ncbi:unnamed protein product [Clonostachys rhizophaga]|uniref:Uncharacterized protein n=1 Tax=Clonostachys rhizophaga TaxID=160324 RepID=A0A9N9W2Y6_9HYPO|nr:unnamed protein product [Clonostachys rhizophaga]
MFAKYSFFFLALATAVLGGVASTPESTNDSAQCKPNGQHCIFNRECCSNYCSWRAGSVCTPQVQKVDPMEEALKAAAEAYLN